MTNTLDIARQFSAGKFEQVADQLSEDVTFHIYEDKKRLTGKTEVLEFCKGIANYFSSVDTDFQESGNLVSTEKVAIYGYGAFRKDRKLINAVHSCDVYEFNEEGKIKMIHSYCNSRQQ